MLKYWLWLQSVMRYAGAKSDEILAKYDSPKHFYEDRNLADKVLTTLNSRDYHRIKTTSLSVANDILDACDRCGINILTPDMEAYPKALLDIFGTPLVLFTKGDVSILKIPIGAAVVGTRKEPTKYATRAAYKLSYDLAKAGVVIVSGMAQGIDSWAHGGALDASGKTVAVAGAGLDIDYPKPNRDLRHKIEQEGLIISEFPPGTKPSASNFPYRNRVISALTCGTIVVQAPKVSGALITARTAIEQGKDVYVVPDSIFCEKSAGSLELMKECGYPITCAIDFIGNYIAKYGDYLDISAIPTKNEYSPSEEILKLESSSDGASEAPVTQETHEPLNTDLPEGLDDISLSVYNLLKKDTLSADIIAIELGIPIGVVLSALTELELGGFIRLIGNYKYTAKE